MPVSNEIFGVHPSNCLTSVVSAKQCRISFALYFIVISGSMETDNNVAIFRATSAMAIALPLPIFIFEIYLFIFQCQH